MSSHPAVPLDSNSKIFYASYSPLCASILNPETDPTQREQKTEELIHTLLDSPRTWPQVGKKIFSVRHLAEQLGVIGFTGSQSKTSLSYWESLLASWQQNECFFINSTLPKATIRLLEEVITEFSNFLDFFEEYGSSLVRDDISENHDQFAEKLLKWIEHYSWRGYTYFPAGYQATHLNVGHSVPARIEIIKDKVHGDKVRVHLLTLGDGLEKHQLLGFKGITPEFSYTYFPIEFKYDDFFGEMGRDIFTRLIRLQLESLQNCNDQSCSPYSAQDVYAIFTSYGNVLNHYHRSPTHWKKTPQVGNICADKGVEIVLRSVLIEQNISKEEIKRLFCSERLFSLIAFYHEVINQNDPEAWKMLELAIREYAIHIHNLPKDLLNASELFICETILSTLKTRLVNKLKSFKTEADLLPFFGISSNALKIPLSELRFLPSHYSKVNPKQNFNPLLLQVQQTPAPPLFYESQAIPLNSLLEDWIVFFKLQLQSKNSFAALQFLHEAFQSLPVPLHDRADFWTQLPSHEVTLTIRNITYILDLSTKSVKEKTKKQNLRHLLAVYTGFAIVDRLCRRIEPRLEGFHPQFCLFLKESDLKKFFTPAGEDNRRFFEIFDYFQILKKRHPKSCFHFQQHSNLTHAHASFFSQLLSGPVSKSLLSHIEFLNQFASSIKEKGLDPNEQLAVIWSKYLPLDIEYLEKLACFVYKMQTGIPFDTIPQASNGQDDDCVDPSNQENSVVSVHDYSADLKPLHKAPFYSREGQWFLHQKEISYYSRFSDIENYDTHLTERNQISYWANFYDLSRYQVSLFDQIPDFFDKKSDSNISLTLPQEKNWKSQKFYKEWRRIFSNPSLQIPAALTWAQGHLPEFKNVLIRVAFERALFSSAVLQQQLMHEPQIKNWLRKVIDEGIEFYKTHRHDSAYLLFIRLGIYTETHIAAALKCPVDKAQLRKYEKDLTTLSPTSPTFEPLWSAHLLLLYEYLIPTDKESLAHLVEAFFTVQCHFNWICFTKGRVQGEYVEDQDADHLSYNPHWSIDEAARIYRLCAAPLLEASQDVAWLHALKLRLCTLLKITSEEVKLDICRATLWKEGYYLKSERIQHNGWMETTQLKWIHPTENYSLSFDRKTKYSGSGSDQTIQVKLDGIYESWCTKLSKDGFLRFPSRIVKTLCMNKPHLETFLPTSADRTRFLLKDGERVLQGIFDDDRNLYIQGWLAQEKLGLLLFYDPRDPIAGPLYQFFSNRIFLSPSEVNIYVDEHSRSVSWVDFPHLNLSFKGVNEQNTLKLECVQHPGYFIVNPQPMHSLKHGLVLEDRSGKQYILFPNLTLKSEGDSFRDKIETESKVSKTYYLYSYDVERDLLISEEDEAYTWLVIYFAICHEYRKGLDYLRLNHSYEPHSQQNKRYISFIQGSIDNSSESLAFKLHLGIYLLQSNTQLVLGNFGQIHQKKIQKFFKSLRDVLIDIYAEYLKHLSVNEATRIPDGIRLTHAEEKMIYDFLLSHNFKEDLNETRSSHLKDFRIRKKMIEEGGTSFMVVPQPYSIYDSNLSVLSPLEDLYKVKYAHVRLIHEPFPIKSFVRATTRDLFAYFPWFYLHAREGHLKPIDFFFMRRHQGEDLDRAMVTIFSYVNKFPDKFSDLNFSQEDAESKTKEIFEAIVDRCNSFYAKFLQISTNTLNIWNKSVVLLYTNTGFIKLPPPLTFKKFTLSSMEKELATLAQNARTLLKSLVDSEITLYPTKQTQKNTFPHAFLPSSTYSENEMRNEIIEGEKKYQTEILKTTLPQLKGAHSLKHLQDQTKKLIAHCEDKIASLEREIEEVANQLPDYTTIEVAVRALRQKLSLRQIGDDVQKIGVKLATQAWVEKDASLIQSRNPTLTAQALKQIFILVAEYHLMNTLKDRLKEVQTHLLKEDISAFTELCLRDHFSLMLDHPVLLVFSSHSKKTYRTSQTQLLTWHLKNDTLPMRLVSLPAGDGKTDVYLPLASELALNKGESVFVVSPQSSYGIDRGKFCHATQRLSQKTPEAWELEIKTALEIADLEKIYRRLSERIEHNIPIHLFPQTLAAAHLQWRIALENKDESRALWWDRIIFLFNSAKKPSLGIFEESRITLSSLLQAKIGMGRLQSVPKKEQKFLIKLYRILGENQIFARSSENQSALNQDDLKKIREKIVSELTKHPDTERYLLTPTNSSPPQNSDEIEMDLLKLAHYFLWDLLPETILLIPNVNHKPPKSSYEEFDAPADKKNSTGAYYENPYITICVTIQGMLQRGLTQFQCKRLAKEALSKHEKELLSERRAQKSNIELLLAKWIGSDVSIHDSKRLAEALFAKRYQPEIIFWYLQEIVLDTVAFTEEQILFTSAHLTRAFKKILAFSATPGVAEMYGMYTREQKETQVYKDTTFAPKVLGQVHAKENQTILKINSLPHSSALDFFLELLHLRPSLFNRLALMTDAGGLFRFPMEEEIVTDFIKFSKENKVGYQGVIYFSSQGNQHSELMFRDIETGEEFPLKGKDIEKSLESHGRKWKDLKLLTLCPIDKMVGFNCPFREDACALVLAGENFTCSDSIQAVMRDRGFSDRKEAVIWVINAKLAHKLETNSGQPCTPDYLMKWSLENEGKKIDQEVLARVFAEIDALMEIPLIEKLQSASGDPKKQIAIWHQYRSGCVKSFKLKSYTAPLEFKETDQLLWEYAETAYRAYNYNLPWSLALGIKKQLEKIITSIKQRIPTLSTRSTQQVLKQTYVYQEQQQQQQTQKMQQSQVTTSLQAEVPSPLQFGPPENPTFLKTLKASSSPLREIFKSEGLSPHLHITRDAIHTARAKGSSLGIEYFKPIRFWLCVKEGEQLSAYCISDEEAALIRDSFLRTTQTHCPYQLALFNSEGNLVKNGPGSLGFLNSDLSVLENDMTFTDFLVDMNFLSMEVFDVARLAQRLETWHDVWPLWTQIQKGYPFIQTTPPLFIEKLIPQHFKNTASQAATAPKPENKGFFARLFG